MDDRNHEYRPLDGESLARDQRARHRAWTVQRADAQPS
jgi:hypothetical protein